MSGRPLDTVVVGAGVTGLSVALQLAERGAAVTVIERAGVAAEASGVQPGGVRRQWGTRLSLELATESLRFYEDLGERLGLTDPPRLEKCGYVFVAHEQESLARLRADVELQRSSGVPSVLLGPDEIAAVAADFDPDGVVGAAFCGEDGYFDRPQGVVEAHAAAAQRHGVRIEQAEVIEVAGDGGGWSVALADGGRVSTERVVLAAGLSTPGLVAPLGYDLPVVPERKFMFYSEPIAERLLEPLVVLVDRHFAAKHLANGRVLASDLAAVGPPETNEAAWRRHVREQVDAHLPRLTYVPFSLLVEGVYDMTPDRQPVVGPLDDDGSLWVAIGFSGHGFMVAPAIGRLVADALADGRHEPLLDALALDRFERGAVDAELGVV